MLSVWCGEVVYEQAWHWQRLLAEARAADAIDDVLLTLTHDAVYTAGRNADLDTNVLGDTGAGARASGAGRLRVVRVDRGGELTYHGPGQLVAYPIRRLTDSKAVRRHVDALIEACVRTAASFGLAARADARRPGVWVGQDKIAAVGVRVSGRVTTHGLAFNVDPDLAEFTAGIVPCGIRDAGVTSLAALGVATSMTEVRHRLVSFLADGLEATLQPATPADLGLTAARAATPWPATG